MPTVTDIRRVLRDHVRFTGDGQPNAPVGAPLPVGDPRSGLYNIDKYELQELLIAILQTQGDPDALQTILADLDGKAELADFNNAVTIASRQGPAGDDASLVPTQAFASGLFFYDTPAPKNAEAVRSITLYAMTAGTQQFVILERTGETTWAAVSRLSFSVQQGWNTLFINMPISEGQYFAVVGGRIGWVSTVTNQTPYIRTTGSDETGWTFSSTGRQLLQYRLSISAKGSVSDALDAIGSVDRRVTDASLPVVRVGMDPARKDAPLGSTSNTNAFYFDTPAPKGARKVKGIEYYAMAAGVFRAVVGTRDGSTFKARRSEMVRAPSAGWHYAPLDLDVAEGEYLGATGGVFGFQSSSSGFPAWFSGAFPDFTVGSLSTTHLGLGFDVSITPATAFNTVRAVSRTKRLGIQPLQENIQANQTSSAGRHFVFDEAAPKGVLRAKGVRVYAMSAGTVQIGAYSRVGDTLNRERFVSVAVQQGWNYVSVDLTVNQGEHLGAVGGLFGYTSGAMTAPIAPWVQSTSSTPNFTPDWTAPSRILLNMAFDLEIADGYNLTPTGRFFGKRGVLLGDSIATQTYSGGWFRYAADVAGCVIQSYGVSSGNGNTLVNVGTDGLAYRPSPGIANPPKADYTNADFVLIQIGTNLMTIGDLSDIPEQTIFDLPYDVGGVTYTTPHQHWERYPQTYAGSLALLTEYIQWVRPGIPIFYITPPVGRPERIGPLPELFAQLGKLYGVTVLNAQAEAGIPDRGRFP